jgi:hypothetical protein
MAHGNARQSRQQGRTVLTVQTQELATGSLSTVQNGQTPIFQNVLRSHVAIPVWFFFFFFFLRNGKWSALDKNKILKPFHPHFEGLEAPVPKNPISMTWSLQASSGSLPWTATLLKASGALGGHAAKPASLGGASVKASPTLARR